MTVQEANRDALGRCKMRGCNLCDGYRKELEQYRALGTVEGLKEAREKQVAKKPIPIITEDNEYICHICPNCEQIRVEVDDMYCRKCGQALKWGEEDD